MWASFPHVGNCPVIKDILVIIVSGFLSSSLNFFNTKFGMELGPVAFLLQGWGEIKLSFDFLNNLKISFLILVFCCLYFFQQYQNICWSVSPFFYYLLSFLPLFTSSWDVVYKFFFISIISLIPFQTFISLFLLSLKYCS